MTIIIGVPVMLLYNLILWFICMRFPDFKSLGIDPNKLFGRATHYISSDSDGTYYIYTLIYIIYIL